MLSITSLVTGFGVGAGKESRVGAPGTGQLPTGTGLANSLHQQAPAIELVALGLVALYKHIKFPEYLLAGRQIELGDSMHPFLQVT